MHHVLISNIFEARYLSDFISSNKLRAVTYSVDSYAFLQDKVGKASVELVEPHREFSDAPEIMTRADALARQIDIHVGALVGNHTQSEPALNWEYWDKFLFATSLLVTSEFLNAIDVSSRHRDIILPYHKNAQDYYFKGGVISSIIENKLLKKGCSVRRLEITSLPPSIPSAWNSSYKLPIENIKSKGIKLVHLPTSFYDQKQLKNLYSSDDFFDIQSPYHNVVINPKNPIALASDPDEYRHPLPENEIRRLYQSFLINLKCWNAESILQIEHWITRHRFQMRAFDFFESLRLKNEATLVAITEHDGGACGPLAHAFRDQRDMVLVQHHSKHVFGPLPNFSNIALSSYIQPRRELSDLGYKPLPRSQNINRKHRNIEKIRKTVVFLLTEVDYYGGVPCETFSQLSAFLRVAVKALFSRGHEVILRPRPGVPIDTLLCLDTNVWLGDLDELARTADVAVSIGQPTSALIDFWTLGCVCIHLQSDILNSVNQYLLPKESLSVVHGPGALKSPDILVSLIEEAEFDMGSKTIFV